MTLADDKQNEFSMTGVAVQKFVIGDILSKDFTAQLFVLYVFILLKHASVITD